MFRRLWNLIAALFTDPGADLPSTSQTRAQEIHRLNRERAVRAITERNDLIKRTTKIESQLRDLRTSYTRALQNSDPALMSSLISEIETCERRLTIDQAAQTAADQIVREVKLDIHREAVERIAEGRSYSYSNTPASPGGVIAFSLILGLMVLAAAYIMAWIKVYG